MLLRYALLAPLSRGKRKEPPPPEGSDGERRAMDGLIAFGIIGAAICYVLMLVLAWAER